MMTLPSLVGRLARLAVVAGHPGFPDPDLRALACDVHAAALSLVATYARRKHPDHLRFAKRVANAMQVLTTCDRPVGFALVTTVHAEAAALQVEDDTRTVVLDLERERERFRQCVENGDIDSADHVLGKIVVLDTILRNRRHA